MSLTKFIKLKEVKEKFEEFFPIKPTLDVKKEIIAKPYTNNYSLVGTAFDYLFRFIIEKENQGKVKIIKTLWIAEECLLLLKTFYSMNKGINKELVREMNEEQKTFELILKNFIEKFGKEKINELTNILAETKKLYKNYLISGKMDEKLIENSLILAQLDTIFRAGTSVLLSKNFIENFGKVNSKDVADLKNLISIIPKNLFRAKKLCILNPSFKEAELVHGADCDLIIDDTIIEIKTIKKLEFRSESFYQLLGYYILNEIGGITILGKIEINKLGIYYSRFGYLFQFNIQDVIDLNKIFEVKKWFVYYAKKLL
jgi:hypothetical protein